MTPSEAVGLGGAALAGYAYLPQITHLIREHCSAGLSERAFALWLASSVLMTVHAITIDSVVFVILGGQQILSTGIIAWFCRRYRDQACPSHEPASLAVLRTSGRHEGTPGAVSVAHQPTSGGADGRVVRGRR